jgi:hypothetical protein
LARATGSVRAAALVGVVLFKRLFKGRRFGGRLGFAAGLPGANRKSCPRRSQVQTSDATTCRAPTTASRRSRRHRRPSRYAPGTISSTGPLAGGRSPVLRSRG